ncbi:MAG: hypothetical protein DKT66_04670 [Candidatus Melainabacteria bacterium]|nr:MAG: hypothetical protein DKT66_04670 [Candidatus Melainabacteria bacterium]
MQRNAHLNYRREKQNVCKIANSGILTRRRDLHCRRQEIGDGAPLLGRFHFGESARRFSCVRKAEFSLF